jgi:hypothetical protein
MKACFSEHGCNGAILAGDHMVIVGEPRADPQQSLRLPNSMLAKLISDISKQMHAFELTKQL